MTEQDNWIERRQRIVRCKAHGLHYDPKLASGCTLCLKQSAKAQPRRAPQLTVILLCVLGIAFVFFRIFGPQNGADAGQIEPGQAAPVGVSSELDPAPYRPLIQALERDLFGPVADDLALDTARASVATAAGNLSASIREREASQAGLAAADAVARFVPTGDDGFDFRDLERSRGDWLRIRARLFEPAPWFAAPDRRGSRKARIAATEFSALAGRLEVLAEEGAAETQAFAGAAGGSGDDARFEVFREDWRRRLAEVWNGKPARPESGTDPRILVAIQGLEQAFKQLWALSSDPGLARGDNPAARFDGILQRIQAAQEELAATGNS